MIIDRTDWVVIAAGVAAIAWVNWYFFVAGRASAPPRRDAKEQRP